MSNMDVKTTSIHLATCLSISLSYMNLSTGCHVVIGH